MRSLTGVLRCSVTVAESDMLRRYILFEVGEIGQWEQRVADWIANYWCVMLEELVPVGNSCSVMPSLRRLVAGGDGRGSMSLDPVRLESVMQVITAAGLSVFTGQEVFRRHDFLVVKTTRLPDRSRPDGLSCISACKCGLGFFWFKTYFSLNRGGGGGGIFR